MSNLVLEAETMQTTSKSHPVHFLQFFYDLTILFSYVLGLAMTVALGAYGLELFFLWSLRRKFRWLIDFHGW